MSIQLSITASIGFGFERPAYSLPRPYLPARIGAETHYRPQCCQLATIRAAIAGMAARSARRLNLAIASS